jgi:hypothetical protein
MSDKKVKTNSISRNETAYPKKYVVTRSGLRVSESEYDSKELAQPEFEHWKKIVSRWPDGTKIEISEFDEKKHRI